MWTVSLISSGTLWSIDFSFMLGGSQELRSSVLLDACDQLMHLPVGQMAEGDQNQVQVIRGQGQLHGNTHCPTVLSWPRRGRLPASPLCWRVPSRRSPARR